MLARIKCLARKVGHAFMVGSQYNSVALGLMLAADVSHGKVICPLPASESDRAIEARTDAILAADPTLAAWDHLS